MQRWVYKTIVIRELALSDTKLNAEGEHGWELVSVLGQDGHTARAFFKQLYDENNPPPDTHRTGEQSAPPPMEHHRTGEFHAVIAHRGEAPAEGSAPQVPAMPEG